MDATAKNNYAIRFAARNGHLDVVNRLLEVPGVDATADNNFAIKWAACFGHCEVVELITEALRLQILDNFYADYRKEILVEEEKSLNLDFLNADLQLKFKDAVLKKMGNITGIKAIIEENIIQKTFIQYRQQISFNDAQATKRQVKVLGVISDGDKNSNPKLEINPLLKKELSESQADKQLEVIQVNPKKENFIPELNKKLNSMHLVQYETSLGILSGPKNKVEENSTDQKSYEFKLN
ncbi:MAG: hypothetical protein JWM09_909 [Francisellaceae bacterium]|nr:hypothetical protein [Francisellaceae bacterium]